MKIDLNGRLIDEKEAAVSVFDHGFMYGIGLFETFRTYDGTPFLLTEHLNRLQNSCREIGIVCRTSEEAWKKRINALLDVNELNDAYVRLSISAGVDKLGLPDQDYDQPTEIIYIKPLPAGSSANKKILRKLTTARNTPEGSVRHKSFHFLNNVLGKRELVRYGYGTEAEGLFLDADGHLAEGIVSNLFLVRDGILHTPSVQTGILPGVTRQFVINLANRAGITVKEGFYQWDDLLSADEVFLTNSVQEIVPVAKLVDELGHVTELPEACEATSRLKQLYRQKAGEAR